MDATALKGELLRAPRWKVSSALRRRTCTSDRSLSPRGDRSSSRISMGKHRRSATCWATFRERVAPFNCESMRYVMRREYELACNWKVYVDNYLEGYHIPVVHPTLHKEIDYDSYRVEPQRYSSIQHAPLRPTGGASDRKYDPAKGPVAEARVRLGVSEHHVECVFGPDADERRRPGFAR